MLERAATNKHDQAHCPHSGHSVEGEREWQEIIPRWTVAEIRSRQFSVKVRNHKKRSRKVPLYRKRRLPGAVDPSIYATPSRVLDPRDWLGPESADPKTLLQSLPGPIGLGILNKPNWAVIRHLTRSMEPFVQDVADSMALRGKVLSDRVLEGVQRLFAGQLVRRTRGAAPTDLDILTKIRYIPDQVAKAWYGPSAPDIMGFTARGIPDTIYLTDRGVMADLALGLAKSKKAIRTGAVGSNAREFLAQQKPINLDQFVRGPYMTGAVSPQGYLLRPNPEQVPGMTTLHELGHLNLPRIGKVPDETMSDYYALLRTGLSDFADNKLKVQAVNHLQNYGYRNPIAFIRNMLGTRSGPKR